MWFLRELLYTIFPPRVDERALAMLSDETLLSSLTCRQIQEGVVSLLPYRTPLVRACVREAKYRGNQKAARLLGTVLAEFIASYKEDVDAYERSSLVLLPIPLSRQRRRERGYNQVHVIAAYAGSLLQVPPTPHLLSRVRHTKAQTTLSKRDRLQNLEGAFRARSPLDPAALYVLVDDVVTTGATLMSAKSALADAGAKHILCVGIAH